MNVFGFMTNSQLIGCDLFVCVWNERYLCFLGVWLLC